MKVGLIERFAGKGKATLGENIIVCIAAALAGTFYFYEYYYESWANVHTLMCVGISVTIALIWIASAFQSGKNGRIGFIIFAFLYWSIPYIYILYYSSRDNLRDYSAVLAFVNRIAKAVLNNPFSETADKLATNSATLAATLLVLIMLAYVGGFFLSRRFKNVHDIREYELVTYEGEYELDDSIYDDPEDGDDDSIEDVTEVKTAQSGK